jgi:hypothetical protein
MRPASWPGIKNAAAPGGGGKLVRTKVTIRGNSFYTQMSTICIDKYYDLSSFGPVLRAVPLGGMNEY